MSNVDLGRSISMIIIKLTSYKKASITTGCLISIYRTKIHQMKHWRFRGNDANMRIEAQGGKQ